MTMANITDPVAILYLGVVTVVILAVALWLIMPRSGYGLGRLFRGRI